MMVRQRGLAQAGGAVREHVVEHFTTLARSQDRHPEDFL